MTAIECILEDTCNENSTEVNAKIKSVDCSSHSSSTYTGKAALIQHEFFKDESQ